MSHLDFEDLIDIPRKCMRIVGVWPESNRKINSKLKAIVSFSTLTFFLIIPQTTKLFYVKNNLYNILNILLLGLTITVISALKLLHQWNMVEEIYELENIMEKEWKVTEKTKLSKMMKIFRLLRLIVKGYHYGIFSTSLIFMIVTISTSFHKLEDPSSNCTDLQFYGSSKFFFDAQTSPIYEIVWLGQIISALLIMVIYPDGFFFISVFHLHAQLDILRLDVKNLVLRSKKENFNELIKNIVERHLQLKRFLKIIEKVQNKIFLLQMIFYSICLCLQGYLLITMLTQSEKDIPLIVFVVDYLIIQLLCLFLTCFVAEKLRDASFKFFNEVCNVNYHEIEPTDRKSLVIIMCASQTPFELTAGKFAVLSLRYYAVVLKTAAGYMSMLRAVIQN